MGTLERIWIKRAKLGPMDPVDRAELITAEGIVGNANFRGKRQVTVLSRERWDAVMAGMGAGLDPAARRANLLVQGLDLEESRGRVLAIGECRIVIRGETRPCERMDEALPGLQEALRPHWGGGAYGEVVAGGAIAVGQPARWVDPSE